MNKQSPIPVFAPALSTNDDMLKLTRWHKLNKHAVEPGEVIATGETAKASFEIISPAKGYLEILCPEDSLCLYSKPIAFIFSNRNKQNKIPIPAIESKKKFSSKVTMKAQRLLSKYGISHSVFEHLSKVNESDVLKYLHQSGIESSFDLQPLTLSQQSMGYGLVDKSPRPVGFVAIQCSYKEIVEALKKRGDFSISEAVVYAASQSLLIHKDLNSVVIEKHIKFFHHVNLGYAINMKQLGLKLPVIRKSEVKNLHDIKADLMQLKMNYLRNELKPVDFTGFTFAITDLSQSHTHFFIPNLPIGISSILGVCAADACNNQFYLCLSFDHQACDGAYASSFLKKIEAWLLGNENAV